MSPSRRALRRFAASAFFCLLLAVAAYTHGGQDDTYITYWSAHALSELGEIVNYNGDRVEQSSSLGLVILLGALRTLLPVSVPVLGYITGLGAFIWTLWLSNLLGAHLVGFQRAWMVVTTVGTVNFFAYWSTSGTEISLTVATALWVVLELSRAASEKTISMRGVARVAAATLVFASMRPETPLIATGLCVVTALVAYLDLDRHESWAPIRVSLAGLLPVCVIVLFRLAYFGHALPNPALTKSQAFFPADGLRYLLEAAANGNPLLLLGLAAAVPQLFPLRNRVQSLPSILLTLLASAYLVFIIWSGGDWMRGGRFFALLATPAVLATYSAVGRLGNTWIVTVAASLIGINMIATLQFARSGEPEGRPLWTAPAAVASLRDRVGSGYAGIELANKIHGRDAVVAEQLRAIVSRASGHLGRPVTILSGQAGLIAYEVFRDHYGSARFLDLWNITSRDLLDCLGMRPFRPTIIGTAHNLSDVLSGLRDEGDLCGLGQLPDVYLGERLRDPRALTSHGYVIVYYQTGVVRDSKSEGWSRGRSIADGHIAVRRDLARALDLPPARVWEWDLNP